MIRFASLFCLGFASAGMAAPCTPQSIGGVWTLGGITADEPGVEEFYRTAPHELMRFNADGTMIYVASSRPLSATSASARLDEADAAPGTDFTYSTDADGQLVLSRAGQPFQAFRCAIAEKADGSVRRGDMILTNVAGAPALRRIQRRVK